jgi:hypothetical protein
VARIFIQLPIIPSFPEGSMKIIRQAISGLLLCPLVAG